MTRAEADHELMWLKNRTNKPESQEAIEMGRKALKACENMQRIIDEWEGNHGRGKVSE